jgi:hypothetical protein
MTRRLLASLSLSLLSDISLSSNREITSLSLPNRGCKNFAIIGLLKLMTKHFVFYKVTIPWPLKRMIVWFVLLRHL